MRALAKLAFLTAAACGTADDPSGGELAERAVQTASLTGLYESAGAEPGQMCVLDRGVGNARFAMVVRAPGGAACSGAGAAARDGSVLRLVMAGDEPCEIAATIADRRVALPAALEPGCAYYCAPGATLAGAAFVKTGGTAEDAMRARDLVGDPLCGGLGTPGGRALDANVNGN